MAYDTIQKISIKAIQDLEKENAHFPRNLTPSSHTLLTFCMRTGTFNCFRVFGLVQVFSGLMHNCTRIHARKANIDH